GVAGFDRAGQGGERCRQALNGRDRRAGGRAECGQAVQRGREAKAHLGEQATGVACGQPGLQRLQGAGQRAGELLQRAVVSHQILRRASQAASAPPPSRLPGPVAPSTMAMTEASTSRIRAAAELQPLPPEVAGGGGAGLGGADGAWKAVPAATERNVHAATWISRSSLG